MTLTEQFLIVGLLPASFLLLAVRFGLARRHQRQLVIAWLLALLTAAVWSSSIMSYYLGRQTTLAVGVTWRVIGAYALSLLPIWLLLATHQHAPLPSDRSRMTASFSALIWVAALVMDPVIWGHQVADLVLLSRTIRLGQLWGAVWVASWLIPIWLAWSHARQTFYRLPTSLQRNQVHYWWLSLMLFLAGGALSLARADWQLGWQELGALLQLAGAAVGTFSLLRQQLPDLKQLLRQGIGQLSSAAVLFGLVLLLLWLVWRTPAGRQLMRTDAGLLLAAALFTAVLILLQRLLGGRTKPAVEQRARHLDEGVLHSTLEPVQLGELILKMVGRLVNTDDAWLFTAVDGPGGRLILRPLAATETAVSPPPPDELSPAPQPRPSTGEFAADSPLTSYLRQETRPLFQPDLGAISSFENLPGAEEERLDSWQRVIYVPLHAGRQLVGLLALGPKSNSKAYDERDFSGLEQLAHEAGRALHQALALHTLYQVSDHIAAKNQRQAQTIRRQAAQLRLYHQFASLIAPDLRRPLITLDVAWRQIRETFAAEPVPDLDLGLAATTPGDPVAWPPEQEGGAAGPLPAEPAQQLTGAIVDLRTMIDNLIGLVTRLEAQASYSPTLVRIEELCRATIRQLESMAEARQVTVTFDRSGRLPPVVGDPDRLQEVLHQLLHNAIKFNKIGGKVTVVCRSRDNEVQIKVIDSGVGIPEPRLESIWSGFRLPGAAGHYAGQGLGIGLPLARSIVEAHGGQLTADSKYGAGSTFTVTLPIAVGRD